MNKILKFKTCNWNYNRFANLKFEFGAYLNFEIWCFSSPTSYVVGYGAPNALQRDYYITTRSFGYESGSYKIIQFLTI